MRNLLHGRWTASLRVGLTALTSLVVAVGLITVPASPARAEPPVCGPPVPSETQPGIVVADPDCDLNGNPFIALTDPAGAPLSTVYTGILEGAAYRIEKPLRWNGELVLFAHGFRGTGPTVFVDSPSLRAHYISRGFAWAASSYQTNGYAVAQGVRDSHALIKLFRDRTGRRAGSVYMTGTSMGGHITAVAIEHFPRSFVGAMPSCGVLGDSELVDYFLDANATAAALTDTEITFPLTFPVPPEFPEQWRQTTLAQMPKLMSGFGAGPVTLTPLGRQWGEIVERRSGGDRPGFDQAWVFWNSAPSIAPLNTVPFLFGVYPGLSAGTQGQAEGNIASNRFTLYQADDNPFLSSFEWRLNRDVFRVSRTDTASDELDGVPAVRGNPRIPVLSLHTLGDLFVPFSMEQIYARRTILHGRGHLFVPRAIRALGHCEFNIAESQRGFDDLVSWVRTKQRPAGDDILNSRKVAQPTFGCRFTAVNRPNFGAPCPA